jgi:hypothetical protein
MCKQAPVPVFDFSITVYRYCNTATGTFVQLDKMFFPFTSSTKRTFLSSTSTSTPPRPLPKKLNKNPTPPRLQEINASHSATDSTISENGPRHNAGSVDNANQVKVTDVHDNFSDITHLLPPLPLKSTLRHLYWNYRYFLPELLCLSMTV